MFWYMGRKTVPVLCETAGVGREKGIGNYADWGLRESQVRRRRDKNSTQLLWTIDAARKWPGSAGIPACNSETHSHNWANSAHDNCFILRGYVILAGCSTES